MTNNYEAPEVVEIGKAQEVILGEKTDPIADNNPDPVFRVLQGIADTDE